MFCPGTAGMDVSRQSRTIPPGWASWPGVSCCSGTLTRSRRTPRWVLACRENSWASRWKVSKSVLVSHGGSIAGVKACTNGCMSVEDRSCFSYQVAAGNTTSDSSVVEVIRKSAETSRSSFPSGACSCHFTSLGLSPSAWSLPRTLLWVPSRFRRKYSLPLAEEPNRLERHSTRVRGQFSGASTSSIAGFRVRFFSASAM